MAASDKHLIDMILRHLPEDGTSVGNKKLMERLADEADFDFSKQDYERIRDMLVQKGVLAKGGGRGGSVRLVQDRDATRPELWTEPDARGELTLEKEEPAKPKPRPEKKNRDVNHRQKREQSGWQADHQLPLHRQAQEQSPRGHGGHVQRRSRGRGPLGL